MKVEENILNIEVIEVISKCHMLSFSLYRNLSDGNEYLPNISLVLVNLNNWIDGKLSEIRLVFEGVIDLKVGKIDSLLIPQIEIKDIRFHQIEGVKFKISEVENSMFTFLCSDFYVT